jgi:hypothetical protein
MGEWMKTVKLAISAAQLDAVSDCLKDLVQTLDERAPDVGLLAVLISVPDDGGHPGIMPLVAPRANFTYEELGELLFDIGQWIKTRDTQ